MQDLIRQNAGLLFAGVASFVLMGVAQAIYGPALPGYARDFGLGPAQTGWLVSAHWVGCAVGVAAMYAIGARVTPRISLMMMGAGALLMAIGAQWWQILSGAVVFGCGYGMATAVYNPRMLRAFGARGPAMLSLLNATFGIGAIAAPLIFVALGSNPAVMFAGVAVLCALIWLGAGSAGRSGATAPGVSRAFQPHWGILAFGMVAIAMEACLIGLGPSALIRAGETEDHAAELLSGFFVAFLLARIVLVFGAHLIASFTLYTLAVGAAFASAIGAALISPPVFFVVMGAATGLFFPSFYVTASAKMGDDLRVPPTIIAAGLVGGIFAPVLFAPLLERVGERGFFWLVAIVTGAATLAALISLRKMNRPES